MEDYYEDYYEEDLDECHAPPLDDPDDPYHAENKAHFQELDFIDGKRNVYDREYDLVRDPKHTNDGIQFDHNLLIIIGIIILGILIGMAGNV